MLLLIDHSQHCILLTLIFFCEFVSHTWKLGEVQGSNTNRGGSQLSCSCTCVSIKLGKQLAVWPIYRSVLVSWYHSISMVGGIVASVQDFTCLRFTIQTVLISSAAVFQSLLCFLFLQSCGWSLLMATKLRRGFVVIHPCRVCLAMDMANPDHICA